MKLYHLPYSHFSAKARITLIEKELSFELQDVNALPDPEVYQQINPSSLVPCLVDGEVTIGEGEVIVEYLEDAYPLHPMLPSNPALRARSRWLSRVHDLYIAPELSALFGLSQATPPDHVALETHSTSLRKWLTVVDKEISPNPYCFGEQFGLVDATYALSLWYSYSLMEQLDQPLDDSQFPAIRAWFSAIACRESFKQVLGDCCAALGLDADAVLVDLSKAA